MEVHVLGLGESVLDFIAHFKGHRPVTIGVNDIARYYKTDHLVVVDSPQAFTADRLNIINSHVRNRTFSNYRHYNTTDFIDLQPTHRLKHDTLFKDYYKSHNSPFVAVQAALRLPDVSKVIVWGADFNTHKKLSEQGAVNVALDHFQQLRKCMWGNDIDLFVGSTKSKLNEVLPLWESSRQ